MYLSSLSFSNLIDAAADLTDFLRCSLKVISEERVESENDVNLVSTLLNSHLTLLELYLEEAL